MRIGVGAFCAAIVPGPTGKKGWIQSQDDRQKLGRTRRFVGASVGIGSYSEMVARNVIGWSWTLASKSQAGCKQLSSSFCSHDREAAASRGRGWWKGPDSERQGNHNHAAFSASFVAASDELPGSRQE